MSANATRLTSGIVTVVGAGPGDPELMTRKGWKALESADVILHDALIDLDGFREAAPCACWIPVGKRAGVTSTAQQFINRMLVNVARRGYHVVRLKGGDPAIFGRLTEELDACRDAGLEVRIVPGVTAASASAADLGISLTRRGVARSVVFVTPRVARGEHACDDSWLAAALAADTVVFYMARDDIQRISRMLIQSGRLPQTPVALLANASRDPHGTFTCLGDLAHEMPSTGSGPVTIILGEAARSPESGARSHQDELLKSVML